MARIKGLGTLVVLLLVWLTLLPCVTRRTGYPTFNHRLYRLSDWLDANKKRIERKTNMTSTQTTALDTLQAALDAAALVFPRYDELP